MCSWCYAFGPTLQQLLSSLPEQLEVRRLLGGLAPDSDDPMGLDMRDYLQRTWKHIEEKVPGAQFNFDFWEQCRPRRSTWRSCRAVIAARQQNVAFDTAMTHAIQQAYYRQARNPSERETLMAIAGEVGADEGMFSTALDAHTTQALLEQEMKLARELGANSFPSLVLDRGNNSRWNIPVDYRNPASMLEMIESLLQ